MIEVYSYTRIRETANLTIKRKGLETFFLFPDMMGRELPILEIVHRYMQESPKALFYVDNGSYFIKREIDIIYNLENPDPE